MRYLALSADCGAPSVRDEPAGDLELDSLSVDLASDVHAWNDGYQPIIPLEPRERADHVSLIEGLDL